MEGAAIDAAKGKVEKDVLRGMEGIGVFTDAAIDGGGEINVVQEFTVQVDADVVGSPVHEPEVEFLAPAGVFVKEVLIGDFC